MIIICRPSLIVGMIINLKNAKRLYGEQIIENIEIMESLWREKTAITM